jgi:DNA segregation ATPase FtsK/SpoIIIE, S-DNA-T family
MTLKPGDIVATVRDDIRRALAVIDARRRGRDDTIERLQAAVTRREEEAAVAAGPQTVVALRRWRRLAFDAAPGLASAPWDAWPAEPEPSSAGPSLYRAGSIAAGAPTRVSGELSPSVAGEAPVPVGGAAPVPVGGAASVPVGGAASVPVGGAAAVADDVRATAATIPALVPLLDAGHLRIIEANPHAADAVVDSLLVRIVATTRPGTVRISLFDPRRLGAGLGGFHALSRPGLLTVYGVDELKDLLGALDRDIRRIQRDVLGGGHSSLAELAEKTGRRPEPWRVVIVQSPVRGLRDDEIAHLQSVMHAGAACGIHVICRDAPVEEAPGIETIRVEADGRFFTSMTGDMTVTPEPPPPELVRAVCERAARWVAIERDPPRFSELTPHRMWTESSAPGIAAPIGEDVDRYTPVDVLLGDDPVHALVGGPPGSGKTNFLYLMIGSLAARYSPDELEFYLLDFKEGVSFARLASGRTDKSWLPHARLIGVNINNDREFGLALLRHLAQEMKRRGGAAREHEVTKLEELRAVDPDGRWPRIVAVIDEFQVLIQQRDKITDESLHLLNDLARRGRSQGIHLVLSSQSVGGLQALWGRGAILDQFTLRVALPRARRILAEDNMAARELARFCAVVNDQSGARHANRIVRLPDAGAPGAFDALQKELWKRRPGRLTPPRIFDGAHVPALLSVPRQEPGVAAVGQLIDLAGSPATVRFDSSPGRNLAVVGTRGAEAHDVLASAVLTLAAGHEPGSAAFVLFDGETDRRVSGLARRLNDEGHGAKVVDELPELHRQPIPTYLALFAVDAATARTPQLRVTLRRLAEHGPDHGTHVLGWWRTADRLKADLGERTGPVRTIDAWVALDVRDSELSPLVGGQSQSWVPRRGRALFHDQRAGSPPQPIIPFEVMSERVERGG